MRRRFDILPSSFYDREPALVAPDLLGKLLIRRMPEGYMVGRIVETEAYLPFGDPASHSFRGKTKRNESMFKASGHAYVHRMRHHTLFNVVTEEIDIPGGVLIRALEPVEGIPLPPLHPLPTNGPGKLCRALGITHALDGTPITDPNGTIFIARDPAAAPHITITTTRIGITKGADMKLRFYISENPYVSKKEKRPIRRQRNRRSM